MGISSAAAVSLNIETILQSSDRRCEEYASALWRAKDVACLLGLHQDVQDTLGALSQILGFHFSPEDSQEPFSAGVRLEGKRSAIPSDYDEEAIRTLIQLAEGFDDAEFGSRIFDVAWVVLRDPKAARSAIRSYLKSADSLFDLDNWPVFFERIERATRLAVQIGDEALQGYVFAKIEGVVTEHHERDPLFLTSRLIELLIEFRRGDAAKQSAAAERVALLAQEQKQFRRARDYLEKAAGCQALLGNKEGRRHFLVLAAESLVLEAQNSNSHLGAAWHLQLAIQAMRDLGSLRTRMAELYEEMRDHQRLQIEEMEPIAFEVPLGDLPDRSEQFVSGKKCRTLYFLWPFCVLCLQERNLKELPRKRCKCFPHSFSFNPSLVTSTAK